MDGEIRDGDEGRKPLGSRLFFISRNIGSLTSVVLLIVMLKRLSSNATAPLYQKAHNARLYIAGTLAW